MNKPYSTPPKNTQVFAVCTDDKNPPSQVQDWVKENKIYNVLGLRPALNTDGVSIILADKNGREMMPSASMGGYKADRFELINIFLN